MQSALNKLAALSIIFASASVIWLIGSVKLGRPTNDPPPATSRLQGLPSEPVDLTDAAVLGGPEVRAGVIVYSDFQCPYCGKFAKETLPQVISSYVNTGKAFVAFRHLPLEGLHPDAMRAAQTAECGRRQGKFWEVHDALFLRPPQDLAKVDARELARSKGLELSAFENCLKGEAIASVERDANSATDLGIRGTPSFLFGTKTGSEALRVIRRESGAIPFRAFAALLDQTISSSGSGGKLR